MSEPVITMTYDNQPLKPAPTIAYSTQLVYNNDLVIGYNYKITLNGQCAPTSTQQDPATVAKVFDDVRKIKNIFASNGGTLSVLSDGVPLLRATEVKILSLNYGESSNNWTRSIPYTIELECNNLHLGGDLNNDPHLSSQQILQGDSDPNAYADLHSPYFMPIDKFKIKSCSETFNLNVDDNIFNQLNVYVDYNPQMLDYTTSISNNYYTVSMTVSATGKHDFFRSGENSHTLPAWENAKRYVHRKLVNNLNKLGAALKLYPSAFLVADGGQQTLDSIHGSVAGNNLINAIGPKFQLFDETLSFSVSESDGTFEATYNAIVKQNCQTDLLNNSPLGCSNSALHTITKTVNKTFNANEQTNSFNQEISISINGQIKGLVPGYNVLETIVDDIAYPTNQGTTGAGLCLANFDTGSFLTWNPYLIGGGTRIDRNSQAEILFNSIFNYSTFDLVDPFKTALGITHEVLNINPNTNILPSKMTLTRNQIEGTINYSAEYNNAFNCPTNHYSIDISVEEPVPLIQEFVIPNNNNNMKGDKGFPFIQYLGTQTAKKISVTINGNIGETFDKCCLGADLNWNLLDPTRYQFFKLGDFELPPQLILPVLDDDYVLTSKSKKTTYPNGQFTISLGYTCATICPIGNLADCGPECE